MKHFTTAILAAALIVFLPAGLSAWTLPDNSSVRREIHQTLIATAARISPADGSVFDGGSLTPVVKFEVRSEGGKTYMLFLNSRDGSFPIISAGNVIVRKDADGSMDQVKIYLDDIGALVLRIRPDGRRSLLELSLYDDVLYTAIPMALSIETVMQTPVENLITLSSGRIPWELLRFSGEAAEYRGIREILAEMKTILPLLPDAEDGAMDEFGNLVRIETLQTNDLPGFNCSGFAKFVSDGIYFALTGSYMKIDDLKQKQLAYRGNEISLEYEDLRDPYFGLDWTRNIATSIMSSRSFSSVGPEAADVRNVPFYRYQEDMGYRVSEIAQVMYLEAIANPGRLYLGSINGEFGSSPQLWQHYHVVVLFPYFDERGTFHVEVLERNVQTSVASLRNRYENEYVHLVAIEPADAFILPQLIANN